MQTKSRKSAIMALTIAFAMTSPLWAQGMGGPGGMGGNGGMGGHGGGMHDGDGWGMDHDSLTTVTVTGTVFTEMILVDPDCDSSFAGPGMHHGPGMGGPGMGDSLGFGHWDSTFFGGFGGYHHGNEWSGMNGNMHQWRIEEHDSVEAGYHTREEGPDSLVYHEIFFLDVDGDSTMDYIMNFGPEWYIPVDSTLSRPTAGDVVTVTGIEMMESPVWDASVLVVTELNGGIWREFGFMGHGGPHSPRMNRGRNQYIGENWNSPNPFNPSTTISFKVLEPGNISVTIYDIRGRNVKTLVGNRYMAAGQYNITWNGTNAQGAPVASGLYLYSISMGSERVNRVITFLK